MSTLEEKEHLLCTLRKELNKIKSKVSWLESDINREIKNKANDPYTFVGRCFERKVFDLTRPRSTFYKVLGAVQENGYNKLRCLVFTPRYDNTVSVRICTVPPSELVDDGSNPIDYISCVKVYSITYEQFLSTANRELSWYPWF